MRGVVFVVILMLSGCGGFIESFAANALGGLAGSLFYDEVKERFTEYGKNGIKEKKKNSSPSSEKKEIK